MNGENDQLDELLWGEAMDDAKKWLYFREIALQRRYGLLAWDNLTSEIVAEITRQTHVATLDPQSRMDELWREREYRETTGALSHTERVFYHVQALLVAIANVSKLLWPSTRPTDSRADTRAARPGTSQAAKVAAEARAAILRPLLGVPASAEASPIGLRDMRDHFEHFDERLDDIPVSASILDMNTGSWADARTGFEAFLRHYDPATATVTFMKRRDVSDTDRLPLKPAVRELRRLARTASYLALPRWYVSPDRFEINRLLSYSELLESRMSGAPEYQREEYQRQLDELHQQIAVLERRETSRFAQLQAPDVDGSGDDSDHGES